MDEGYETMFNLLSPHCKYRGPYREELLCFYYGRKGKNKKGATACIINTCPIIKNSKQEENLEVGNII